MSTQNKDLVLKSWEAINARDLDAAAAPFAEDFVNHAAIPEAQGAAGLRRIFGKLLKAFPDARYKVESILAEADTVACRVSMEGTNSGPLEFVRLPLPATGKKVRGESLHTYRFANGKVVEHWSATDQIGMMRQLGHALPGR